MHSRNPFGQIQRFNPIYCGFVKERIDLIHKTRFGYCLILLFSENEHKSTLSDAAQTRDSASEVPLAAKDAAVYLIRPLTGDRSARLRLIRSGRYRPTRNRGRNRPTLTRRRRAPRSCFIPAKDPGFYGVSAPLVPRRVRCPRLLDASVRGAGPKRAAPRQAPKPRSALFSFQISPPAYRFQPGPSQTLNIVSRPPPSPSPSPFLLSYPRTCQ